MKIVIKVLAWIIGVFITLIVVFVVSVTLSENKIADSVMVQVEDMINAPVAVENVSFDLLHKFPYATIELNGIYLGSAKDSLQKAVVNNSDTILYIGKIYLSVKSKPLMAGVVEVVKVEIEDVDVSYTIDTDSISNIDFLIPVTDTALVVEEIDTVPSAPINASLEEFIVRNVNCYYKDSANQTVASIYVPEITMKASMKGDTIMGAIVGSVEAFGVNYPETNAHLMQRTKVLFDIVYNTVGNEDSITINNVELLTDGACIGVKGKAVMGDEIYTDLQIDIDELNIGELIKYAPADMLKEFGIQQVAGYLSMNAAIKGYYSDSTNQMPHVNATMKMRDGLVKTADYPTLKDIAFSGKVNNGVLRNNETTQVDFSTFHFETEQSTFDIAFSVLDIDHPKYNVNTNMQINVGEFASFIPDSTVESIQGIVYANFKTKGILPETIDDDFTDYLMANSKADVRLKQFNVVVDSSLSVKNFNVTMSYRPNHFKMDNLGLEIPEYGAKLKNTAMDALIKGKLSDSDNIGIELKSFNIETDSSSVRGDLTFINGEFPYYSTNTTMSVNLAEMYQFVPDSLLDHMQGEIVFGMQSSGKLNMDSITDHAVDLAFLQSEFSIDAKGVAVHVPNDPMSSIDGFSGKINMNKEGIYINDMEGIAAGIHFMIDSTEIKNVYETIMKEDRGQAIVVESNMHFGIIDYNKIMAMMPPDTVPVDSVVLAENGVQNIDTLAVDTTDLLPDFVALGIPHFLFRGKISADKIIYEKNILDDVSMDYRFTDSLYVIDQFKLKTCDGDINTSLRIDARKNYKQPMVDMKNYINGMDLNQLLINNDNFDDTTLTAENLSGILTSEMHARAFYIDGDFLNDKTKVIGHFTLEDGKIYNFQPLVDASVGIGGLKELDKMDFNTLKTSIFMFKDKVYVPETHVVSNALDLTAFAMHGMTDEISYEYHLVMHLGDVLKGKSDKLMEEQAKQNKKDGGTVERNGLNLVALNREGEEKNGFDNAELKNKFKVNLIKQEGKLNLYFNPLLVSYSTALDRSTRAKEILKESEKNK